MSVLSDILERLTALTNWKNSVTANSKTTSELDAQGTLNTSSLIRVSIGGVSQFITVQQIVDAATLSTNNVGTNGIVSGTIEYVEGLTYRTLNLVYRINNVLYYSNGFSIILNAGGTLKRTDVIYGDAELDGQILVLEGEEATIPIKPIVQWGYQLELTFATIATSATAPEGVSEFTLYDENLQQAGGEYNTSTNTPLQVDLANTTLFNTGAKSIKFINAGTVGINLTSTVKRDGANISFVKFRVYLTDANKSHRLQLSFWVNNTLRTGDVTVTHGMFNFDSYLINTWQTIVIPGTAFAVNGVWGAYQYDDLYFQNRRSGCTFYVDTITIQEGVTTQNNTSNHTHANYAFLETLTQADFDAKQNKLTAGTNITIDETDPLNPVINASGSSFTIIPYGYGLRPTVGETNAIYYDETYFNYYAYVNGAWQVFDMSEVFLDYTQSNRTAVGNYKTGVANDYSDIEAIMNGLSVENVMIFFKTISGQGGFAVTASSGIDLTNMTVGAGSYNKNRHGMVWAYASTLTEETPTVSGHRIWTSSSYISNVANFYNNIGLDFKLYPISVNSGGVALGETDTTAHRGDRGKTAYDHSQATHAPTDAQKNSDITKAEIEAKLIGEITSHTHAKLEVISYACSDETTDLTLGDKITIRMPFAMTLSEVRISLNVAPTITKLIVDVKESGVSIFSTLPSIDTTELTSVTAAIPPVISDVNLADDAVLVVSITQLGSGAIGKGLKITLKGVRI